MKLALLLSRVLPPASRPAQGVGGVLLEEERRPLVPAAALVHEELVVRPLVELAGLDLADVDAHLPVKRGAVHADEDPEPPRAPLWVWSHAVEASPILRLGEEALEERVPIELLSRVYHHITHLA